MICVLCVCVWHGTQVTLKMKSGRPKPGLHGVQDVSCGRTMNELNCLLISIEPFSPLANNPYLMVERVPLPRLRASLEASETLKPSFVVPVGVSQFSSCFQLYLYQISGWKWNFCSPLWNDISGMAELYWSSEQAFYDFKQGINFAFDNDKCHTKTDMIRAQPENIRWDFTFALNCTTFSRASFTQSKNAEMFCSGCSRPIRWSMLRKNEDPSDRLFVWRRWVLAIFLPPILPFFILSYDWVIINYHFLKPLRSNRGIVWGGFFPLFLSRHPPPKLIRSMHSERCRIKDKWILVPLRIVTKFLT